MLESVMMNDDLFSSRLISHVTMQREVSWKASQIVFFARCAYFTPLVSKSLASAAKDTFFKVLDSPCKKLEDLSNLLSLVVNELSNLVPTGDFSDEVCRHFSISIVVIVKHSSLRFHSSLLNLLIIYLFESVRHY